MSIPFVQYLPPHGRRVSIEIDRPTAIEMQAEEVMARGLRFEAEVLSTGAVSLTVYDPRIDEDVLIELCHNDEQVLEAVDRLVADAFQLIQSPTEEADHD